MAAFELSIGDLERVCRDLAWSEASAMAGVKAALAPRAGSAHLQWSSDAPGALALDSLARMQLATAAATWCNAYDAGYEDLFLAKRSVADWAQVMLRARASGARHFTFSTSGSTGTRKHIRHFEEVLASEAVAWAQVLRDTDNPQAIQRVVVLCPTHHIYGFIWGVLLPLALGVPALDVDLANARALLLPADLVVAVPDQWAWLAQSRAAAPGVQGVSSTAPLASAVHHRLTTPVSGAPFLSRLLQIYGSSETAGLAWRDDPGSAYQLAPGRSRTLQGGISLQLPSGAEVAMAVQDQLAWVGDRTFNLIGRADSMVQVGGHNVSPEWVASKLQSHPAVKQAVVRLNSEVSPRLKAFVVLHEAGQLAHQGQVETWALSELPDHACPKTFTYGELLPTNVMGKPSDWLVA